MPELFKKLRWIHLFAPLASYPIKAKRIMACFIRGYSRWSAEWLIEQAFAV